MLIESNPRLIPDLANPERTEGDLTIPPRVGGDLLTPFPVRARLERERLLLGGDT